MALPLKRKDKIYARLYSQALQKFTTQNSMLLFRNLAFMAHLPTRTIIRWTLYRLTTICCPLSTSCPSQNAILKKILARCTMWPTH